MKWLVGILTFLAPAVAFAASSGGAHSLAILPLVIAGGAMAAAGTAAAAKGATSGYSGNYSGKTGYDPASYGYGQQQAGGSYQQNQGFLEEMRRRMMGQGPSAAQAQLQSGFNQAIQQQYGMAAGATPQNRALMARQASMNAAGMQQDMANSSAALRAQEMQQYAGMYGQGTQAQSAQDAQMQTAYAEMAQQAALEQEKLRADAKNARADRWTQLGGALISGGGRMMGSG